MNPPKRPNQDALYQALNIYRDAMRPFILRNLKTVQGLAPEDRFQNEADIDIGDFPHLFRRYWHNAFEQRFDPDRDVRSAIGIITEARNQVSHPGTEDIDPSYALSRLHDIADVLGQINAPEQKREVESIRDKLLTRAAPTVDTKPKLPRRKAFDLKSWRDVIRPNTDVIEGSFRKSAVQAGTAGQVIAEDYQEISQQREVHRHLPEAWENLLSGTSGDSEFLIEAVQSETHRLCGNRPTHEQVLAFLDDFRKGTETDPQKTSERRKAQPQPLHTTLRSTVISVRRLLLKVREKLRRNSENF